MISTVFAGIGLILALKYKGEFWHMQTLPIYSYGVMLGLSLIVGWYLSLSIAVKDGLPKEIMANNYVITAISAVAGSRLLYVLTNLQEFETFQSMFAMRNGGLVAYGGFLGGFIGSYFYLKKHNIPLLPWADAAVTSLASGLMITRIGCYLYGCDFGQPLGDSAPSWLKKLGSFPHWPDGLVANGSGSPAWFQHVKERGLALESSFSLPVHPTQIYESLVGLFLLVLLFTTKKYQKFRGQMFLLFTFSYGFLRYSLEMIRDDAERGSLPPSLPSYILIPLGLFIFSIGFTVGISKMISNPSARKMAVGVSFLPGFFVAFVLKPDDFALSSSTQWSTSQMIAVSTGFISSILFGLYYKAALLYPESAMRIDLGALKKRPGNEDNIVEDESEDGKE